MINKEKIDKYDILFKSVLEFTYHIGLCKRSNTEGASDEKIKAFCEKHNTVLPPALWSYLRHFGESTPITNSEYNFAHSFLEFDHAMYHANQRDEWYDNMTLKEFLTAKSLRVNYDAESFDDNDGIYTPEIKNLMNIDHIVVYHYDPSARTFKFVNSKEENPYIYYFTKYETLTSDFTSTTNKFRDIIYTIILFLISDDQSNITPIFNNFSSLDSSNQFECIEKYKELLKSMEVKQASELKRLRTVFYEINNKVEEEENRILSFTEFENSFIDYLQENNFNS